jgi:ubiquinone biosynthesis protein COQ9
MAEIDVDAQRREIMQAALPHAPFDGWTWAALQAAGEDLGHDKVDVENAFPDGPAGAIELFSTEADYAMLAALEEHDLQRMRTRDRVALAVRLRLEQNAAHKEAIRRALSFLAMPAHAPLATRLLYQTTDAIWTAAGDASVDYNFYTKRALLAGVYSSTLLYWLDDPSEDHTATWAFLDKRIDEVVRIGGGIGKTVKSVSEIPGRILRLMPERPRRPQGMERFNR